MKKWSFVALLLVGATVLGGTVLREPIANAAQAITVTIVGPLDGQGNVKVHEQGTANVNVVGPIQTHEAIPPQAFSVVKIAQSGGLETFVVSGPDPAGTNYAITSLTVANPSDQSVTVRSFGDYGTTSNCLTFQAINPTNGPALVVPAHDTGHADFPQPFVVSAQTGATSCLDIDATATNAVVEITVVGFRF